MTGAVEFGTFVQEESVNPWIDTVNKLAAIEDDNAAVTITVDVNDASKETFKFQRAANKIGKTARIRKTDRSGVKAGKPDADGNATETGNVKITLSLTKMHKARRGGKAVEATPAASK